MIEELISKLQKETEYCYYFGGTARIEDCVVYQYYSTSDDRVKQEYRLELHIIVKGIDTDAVKRIEQIKAAIHDCVLTAPDHVLTGNIRKVTQNGGGQLTDENTRTTHQILYYDILYRKGR